MRLSQRSQFAGGNWTTKESGSTVKLNSLHIRSANLGWLVGDSGVILKTDGTVQKCITDSSADDLKLGEDSCQNVRTYVLGVGKTLGAQTGAVPGNDGLPPQVNDYLGSREKKTGIYALLDVDIFNILCLPGMTDFGVLAEATALCEERRAFLLMDCPQSWQTFEDALGKLADYDSLRHKNAALYFPWVSLPDPLNRNRLNDFPPCGIVAGIFARTDTERGVWKAPAGQEASLRGVNSLVYKLIDQEHGFLNPKGLNCFRNFPVVGPVIWGARTLEGADQLASEWKYIPVRRLALFLEESLYRGVKWVVFEPNDEPLWSQIRLNVGAFMHNLFRQGAFQGRTPREAYFVKCDQETTTQNDIDLGIVNILVGFAPLKPAEFVILKISQIAGQVQT